MITIVKLLYSFNKFSLLILKETVWRSVRRICILILGLKGLNVLRTNNQKFFFVFQPDLVTSEDGVAEYKGCPMVTSAGQITASFKNAQIS